jgi:hypothetical protein
MVARLLGLDAVPTPDHAADALAVAIAELNRAPLTGLVDTATQTRAAGARPPAPARRPARPTGSGRGVSAATLARARRSGESAR